MLLLEAGDFRTAGHGAVHQFLVLAPGVVQVISLIAGQDGFPQEIEEHSVECLEAVLIAQVISEQDVLLEKEDVVLAAFDKGQAVVQNISSGRAFVAEQRFSGPSEAVLLDVHNRLKHMLAHGAEQIAAVGLQFGEAGLDHMGLLGAIEMRAASADPLLGFEQEIRKLRADFLREVLQQGHAEQQIDLDIFFVLGFLKPRIEKIGKLPLPGSSLGRACGFSVGLAACGLPPFRLRAVGLRKKRKIGVLADKFQQVRLGRLDKCGTQENVVMDVVHPNGQSAEGKLRRIGLQVDSRGGTRREHGRAFRHKSLREAHLQVNKGVKREQGGEAYPLTADRTFLVGYPEFSVLEIFVGRHIGL